VEILKGSSLAGFKKNVGHQPQGSSRDLYKLLSSFLLLSHIYSIVSRVQVHATTVHYHVHYTVGHKTSHVFDDKVMIKLLNNKHRRDSFILVSTGTNYRLRNAEVILVNKVARFYGSR